MKHETRKYYLIAFFIFFVSIQSCSIRLSNSNRYEQKKCNVYLVKIKKKLVKISYGYGGLRTYTIDSLNAPSPTPKISGGCARGVQKWALTEGCRKCDEYKTEQRNKQKTISN